MTIDAATRTWIRNAADERAAARGCRFNEARGRHVVEFAAAYLRLYEGEYAGRPMEFRDWQVEATMRLFGWERWSDEWQRWVRRFTQASVWVPKKNKKSPTLAAWAIYLLVADGEQGQKVYLAAKDGQQSREIAGRHVLEMVQASDDLKRQCSVNKSLMQVLHEPTRSILKPISSADSKAQKAKEGLNGCVLVDETHVVDREFMSRVSRAGISRSEPLLIEVSTAGDDPESYGKERFDYGTRVEAGDVDDDGLFFLSYAAPQDLGDAELAADPVRFGKMANPAWGHTVQEREFLEDYNRSRTTPAALADFKKYRLNVWQKSANPWLPAGAWGVCEDDFTEADLLGRDCYGGLDLAKTRDTSALALLFPWDDGTYRLLVNYWLPRRRAEELARDVRYLDWARDGWLTLTEGEVVDYLYVGRQVNELRARFNIVKMAYDGVYAHQLCQRLVQEDGWDEQTPELFPQTITHFAGATAMFERLVRERKIRHDGNPCMAWQVGHTTVKNDLNANMRPVKPRHGAVQTIDGSVAAIMALAVCDKYKDQFGVPRITVL